MLGDVCGNIIRSMRVMPWAAKKAPAGPVGAPPPGLDEPETPEVAHSANRLESMRPLALAPLRP